MDYLSGDDNVSKFFALPNILGNIILFIPLGVYVSLFSKKTKLINTVLWSFLISLIVEIFQYTFKLGIGDIDDILLNALGGFLGAVLYEAIWLIFKDKVKLRNFIALFAPICGILSFVILFHYNQ